MTDLPDNPTTPTREQIIEAFLPHLRKLQLSILQHADFKAALVEAMKQDEPLTIVGELKDVLQEQFQGFPGDTNPMITQLIGDWAEVFKYAVEKSIRLHKGNVNHESVTNTD